MIGIYFIENVDTGAYYIGSSIHIERRIIEHKSALKNNRHRNKKLQNSYNKHDFIFYPVLDFVIIDRDDLYDIEQEFIDNYNPKYNLNDVAKAPILYGKDNPFYGKKHTEETKQKNREAHLGANNSRSVSVTIDGVDYGSQREAARELGIAKSTMHDRLHSNKFPNYILK